MTLLYRVGDEIVLHAPREVLEHVDKAVTLYLSLPRWQVDSFLSPDIIAGLVNFANAIRSEAQHEPVNPNSDLVS